MDDLVRQHHADLEQVILDIDEDEVRQLSLLEKSIQTNTVAHFSAADKTLSNSLKASNGLSDTDVQKIVKLHKAEMKEFDSQYN